MRTNESRQMKIDLQIRKCKDNLSSPANYNSKIQIGSTKSTNKSKKLNLTIHNKSTLNRQTTRIAPPTKIFVSQFRLREESSRILTNRNQSNLNIQAISNKQNKQPAVKKEQSLMKTQADTKRQQQEKKQVLTHLEKKESQIQFYQQLLQQKNAQYNKEMVDLSEYYERYIERLIGNYQQEVEKTNELIKFVVQVQTQKELQAKRQIINMEGKMGLNFSPKQLSTFSGMSGDSIIFESLQRESWEHRRNELYSFGSSNKHPSSQQKEHRVASFLNPGRALLKGKVIAFD